MNRGHNREKILAGDGDKALFLSLLAGASKMLKIRILAYCILDNHYHPVIENSSGRMGKPEGPGLVIFLLKILSYHDMIFLEVKMPAVSFYLKKNVLEAIRSRAEADNIPISQIISKAVEAYLQISEKKEARKKVLKHLKHCKLGDWEELHQERSFADAGRN